MQRVMHVAVAAGLVAACAGNPAPVPLAGDPSSYTPLAGRWEGTYTSAATGRTGSIVFELVAGDDHARGDVVMIPAGGRGPLRPSWEGAPFAPAGPAPDVLTIEFVRLSADSVHGHLAPYQDPECGCTLQTTFVGHVRGDIILGIFTSVHSASGKRQGGEWEVRRRR